MRNEKSIKNKKCSEIVKSWSVKKNMIYVLITTQISQRLHLKNLMFDRIEHHTIEPLNDEIKNVQLNLGLRKKKINKLSAECKELKRLFRKYSNYQ